MVSGVRCIDGRLDGVEVRMMELMCVIIDQNGA
jgi:hypothetical protein